jgi:hypothetical protein
MRLAFLILSWVSLPAIACPNLVGNYKICRSSTDPDSLSSISVEQSIVNKYNQYTFTTYDSEGKKARVEKYIADGKTKVATDTDADTGITMSTRTLTTCKDNYLNIKMDATLDSAPFANITIKASKDNNQLIQVFSGVSMGEPVSDRIICE